MDTFKDGVDTLTLTEAKERLGVSRGTLWRLIKTYNIKTFTDVLDTRVKRVRLPDIERVLADAERVRRGIAA